MSKGTARTDKIMAPLSLLGGQGIDLDATVYNKIYEAVHELNDYTAERLVRAILLIAEGGGRRQ